MLWASRRTTLIVIFGSDDASDICHKYRPAAPPANIMIYLARATQQVAPASH
ncbi:MAG: hypothetical protein R6X32_22140 [Chloroflexota bacterium]|jgi:hypothetical protein